MKESIFNFVKSKKIYFIVALVLMILLILLVLFITNRKEKNNIGNLINNGFVTKTGNWIYYAKEDGIYKIKSDNTKKISERKSLYLNIEGKYLYFIEEENNSKFNLVKMKTNGKNKQILVENIDDKMILVKNGIIYYSQNKNLFKIKTNGKDRKKISEQDILTYQIKDNTIYYVYTDGKDYLLTKMKLDGTNVNVLETQCNLNFYVKGNKIYYIKEEYNTSKYEYDYTLCSMKINGKNKKELTKIPNTQKQINISDEGIYYLTTENYENYEIYKMKYNGEKSTKIVETSINSKINVIDKIVYYTELNDSEIVIKSITN